MQEDAGCCYVAGRTMNVWENRLKNGLLKHLYDHPTEVIKELKNVRAVYRDLSVNFDFYCHSTGFKSQLVNVNGTIPVSCEGQIYNLPITIWLHNTHPKCPPKCFVKGLPVHDRTTGDFLDDVSNKSSSYLCNWKYPRSQLLGLVEEIKASFTNSLNNSPQITDSEEAHCAKDTPFHSGENASNKSEKISYVRELMAMGISFTHPPTKASPPVGMNSEDHVVQKKIDSVKQTADFFDDLHIDKVIKTLNLMTPSLKNQDLTSLDAQRPRSHKDKQRVQVLNIPTDLPEHRMKDKLSIFFQSFRNGGGEIADLQYPGPIPASAIITFVETKVAERLVQQGQHLFTHNNKNYPVHLKFHDDKDVVSAENDIGNNISTVDIKHDHQNWQGLPSNAADSSKEKSDLFQRLLSTDDQNFSAEDVMEVVQSGLNYESALRYLSHECPICSEQVSFSRVVTMTHCSCSFCENCFKNYFTSVIKEQSIVNVVCPICRAPNLKSPKHKEDITEYFNFMDIQIRHYLDGKTHELFQRKLRDRTLMEMANFRWCAHWEPQHEGISCEQFMKWKQQNNPEYQARALDSYLKQNGIECPNCTAQFDLSRGGCMHFNCQECQHQFCGGCRRPFKLGSACAFMENCVTKGLHAHHPRNCFYYLRDWSVERMKQLLTIGPVPLTEFIADTNHGQVEDKCKVMEQRESLQYLKDEQCGQSSVKGYSGICNIHLKQHLVELINTNNLDPAVLYSKVEILMELQRWNISVPNKHLSESEDQFIGRLRHKIMKELKLAQQTILDKNSGLL
ncbi:E3 ubiquitin-protein ligase RNF31 isoform X2 [Amblyraja radiata]|uniref:E3 ubiquitin-protein ligase RNF31 isoform X2 n=1 Tax=Amblyraja radiata TaxID=386614 RepID=UPI00140319B5|nr:E3 ubiquitin-protein ligase RNF31 isoform X2 [Amblyraja radiata]